MSYTTRFALAIYRDWAARGKHRQLAAARYWLQYGIGEAGCDHDRLYTWLEGWWAGLSADERRQLDDWMETVHRTVEQAARRYAAAQRERAERIARARVRWVSLPRADEDTSIVDAII